MGKPKFLSLLHFLAPIDVPDLSNCFAAKAPGKKESHINNTGYRDQVAVRR